MITIQSEKLSTEEYIDFLKRTDLGSQYPEERFHERIPKLLENASISLTAREMMTVVSSACCFADCACVDEAVRKLDPDWLIRHPEDWQKGK